jgi:hypothetical protein
MTRNWIIWRGGKPSDFVLRLDFKYEAGNSGVQVRSDDQGNHQVYGHQVEVAAQKVGLWHHSLLGATSPEGVIALQDHGKGYLVAFRNIRIKELPRVGK